MFTKDFEVIRDKQGFKMLHKELKIGYQRHDALRLAAFNKLTQGTDPCKPIPKNIYPTEEMILAEMKAMLARSGQ